MNEWWAALVAVLLVLLMWRNVLLRIRVRELENRSDKYTERIEARNAELLDELARLHRKLDAAHAGARAGEDPC